MMVRPGSPTIAHLMTSVSRGGLEQYVRTLILKLHGEGIQQLVICDQNAFMVPELREHGIPVEFIRPGSRYSVLRILFLRRIDAKYAVDIWHSHQRDDMILVALAFFFRRKFRHIFSLYMGFARKRDLLHRLVYGRVEKIVSTSKLMNLLALERLPIKPGQILCIRYGREENAFVLPPAKIKSTRKTVGVKAGQKLVVSLCRLDPMKGVREFAEAARFTDNKMRGKFLFLQIGERTITGFNAEGKPVYLPESEDAYRQLLAAERGSQSTSRYKLLPFQKDFIPFLVAADYFVLGSYDEMYSLSMIDAMMAGCLVIGTNNGGTTEQLADNRGLLVETKSATAIAAALERAERNPALRQKMQKASHSWALKEHTWKAVLPQWLSLYGIEETAPRKKKK